MPSSPPKRVIAVGSAIGHAIAIAYILTLFLLIPPFDQDPSVAQRLALAIKSAILPGFMFMVGIAFLAKDRFYGQANNPMVCETDGAKMKVDARYLSNTHEQFVLFLINAFALAIFLPTPCLTLLPIYGSLFAVGRMVFWIGYRIHPLYRAPGFTMCFGPAIAAMVFNVYALLVSLFA